MNELEAINLFMQLMGKAEDKALTLSFNRTAFLLRKRNHQVWAHADSLDAIDKAIDDYAAMTDAERVADLGQ